MYNYLLPAVFILGMVWGSFINMAVYRVKHELSFSGRSFCDGNKEKLGALDLIPILSFFIFRGKCRHCRKKLPWIYPLIEIITGLCFCLAFLVVTRQMEMSYWYFINLCVTFTFVVFFIFFGAYDYLYWQVNVKAIRLALIFAVVVAILSIIFSEILISGVSGLGGGLIAGSIIALIVKFTKGSGMGEGDIYLMAFAGVFVGLMGILPLFMISSITGAVVGIIKAVKIGKLHGVQIQFVPFISFAALMIFFFGDEISKLLYLDAFINIL